KLRNIDFAVADILVAEDYFSEHVSRESCREEASIGSGTPYKEEELQSMVSNMMGIREAEWIAESAIANGEILGKLLDYSFSDDKKLAFRASWTLSKVYDKIPEVVVPHLNR